jgi:hypothetical protein
VNLDSEKGLNVKPINPRFNKDKKFADYRKAKRDARNNERQEYVRRDSTARTARPTTETRAAIETKPIIIKEAKVKENE